VIVDTNVIISAFDQGATDHARCQSILFRLAEERQLFTNEIIFAELSGRFDSVAAVEMAFENLRLKLVRLSLDECHRAGQAFREYRRRKGSRSTILPDFLIGAQAELQGWPLLTRDRKGFESYFPTVELIDPHKVPND
jgi:predicted nucleic acid-binding protein